MTLRREKMTQTEADKISSNEQLVTIQTRLGAVKGIRNDGYREFRGIRFATTERWKDAVPVTEKWEGVYDATRWGDRSFQHLSFYDTASNLAAQFYADESLVTLPAKYSADSLNLNIWAPDNAENCPVLVFIHGGAFTSGSNTDTSTDGECYAKRGVIMVAVNYRLGPFSNIYGDGYEGNVILTDNITALRWIRDNIADYGGNPDKITVMGESAGAVGVQSLLISPLVEDGLIAGAIMLSGGGDLSVTGNPAPVQTQEQIWGRVMKHFGATKLTDLVDIPEKDIFDVWAQNLCENRLLAAMPIINGTSLTHNVAVALDNNSIKDVPVMFGMLEKDMMPFILYTAAIDYAKKRANVGGKPVYLYYFDRIQPGDTTFGAFHAADLYYVFGTLYRNQRPFDDVDFRIAENMIDYISNFVKNGNPNCSDLPVWEPATIEKQRFINFGDNEPRMMEPSAEKILNIQNTSPMFPLASEIRSK